MWKSFGKFQRRIKHIKQIQDTPVYCIENIYLNDLTFLIKRCKMYKKFYKSIHYIHILLLEIEEKLFNFINSNIYNLLNKHFNLMKIKVKFDFKFI